jgi:L-lactate dehydrogenase complex protein LldF
MDFLQAKRAAHFGDAAGFDALRRVGEAIRRYSLSRLPDLLERLEQRLWRWRARTAPIA